jgi:hypothetical protein
MDVTPEMQPTASGSPEAVHFDHALESLGDAPASFGKNDGARPAGPEARCGTGGRTGFVRENDGPTNRQKPTFVTVDRHKLTY